MSPLPTKAVFTSSFKGSFHAGGVKPLSPHRLTFGFHSTMFLPLAQALPGLPKLRDIAGPLPVSPPPETGLSPSHWVLVIAVSLPLAALLIWFFSRERLKPVQPPGLLDARNRLRAAVQLVPNDPANELPTQLTNLFRLYLGEAFFPDAVSTPTEDFQAALVSRTTLPLPLSSRVVAFLQSCDRYKFVPLPALPDAAERSRLHSEARDVLEELALAQANLAIQPAS